jgi:glycosyltransferase involved in cell wall biosynthesis
MGGLRQYFFRLFRELLDKDLVNSYVFFHGGQNVRELEQLGNERWREGAVLIKDQNEILHHLGRMDVFFCPFGALWPRPVPLPTVVTLVDIQEKYFPEFFSANDHWNRQYHYEGSTRSADQVITISEFSRQSIIFHHRIASSKIHVVYLAADDDFYAPYEGGTALNLPEKYIFYPANRWLHKNHDNLLKALVVLREESGLLINCVLTGFDYETGFPLREKIEEYGLRYQVDVIGYVSKEQLRYIYRNAEMLCFPSYFEGFGMPLVEAMAIGCPVVCSNTTSMPEVGGDAALLFDPTNPHDIAEKIQTLWRNPDLARTLTAKGREQAKRFSVKNLAAGHLEIFARAERSYSWARYVWEKYMREPLHFLKMMWRRTW